MKGYLNVSQTCDTLGVKRTTLYKIINEGAFSDMGATIIHRNKQWFSEKAINKYIEAVIQSNKVA